MIFHAKRILLLGAAGMIGLVSCKKDYLDRQGSVQVPVDDAFKTTAGVRAAVNGLHRSMYETNDDDQFGQRSIDLMNDLMGADMPISASGAGWFLGAYNYTDHKNASGTAGYTWTFYYRMINNANQILAHVANATGTQEERDNLKGQALFYRAFAYFNLSIYYQFTYKQSDPNSVKGLPLYLVPDRTGAPRGTLQQTYNQIIADLDEAVALLGDGGPRTDKSQIDGSVVKGLYARVALVMQDWAKAAQMASQARQAYSFMSKDQLLAGFNSIENNEWMWGSRLQADQTSNTYSFLSHMVFEAGGYAALGMQKRVSRGDLGIYDAVSATDVRKDWWFSFKVPQPYKNLGYAAYSQRKYNQKIPGTFITDVCYMRASEMALIEAEALANLGQGTAAAGLMNELIGIRDNSYTAPAEKVALINDILLQRRIELWGEGFAYSDIMRLMAYDEAIYPMAKQGLHRGTGHSSTLAGNVLQVQSFSSQFLFRIPGSELENNKALTGADQNP